MIEYLKIHPVYQLLLFGGIILIGYLAYQIVTGDLSLPNISIPSPFKKKSTQTAPKKKSSDEWPWWKAWGSGVLLFAGALGAIGAIFPAFLPLLWEKVVATIIAHQISVVILVVVLAIASLFPREVSWTMRVLGLIAFLGLMYNNSSSYSSTNITTLSHRFYRAAQLEQLEKSELEIDCQLITAPRFGESKWSEAIKYPSGLGNLGIRDIHIAYKNLGRIITAYPDGSYDLSGENDGEVVKPANGGRPVSVGPGERKVFTNNELSPGAQFQSGGKTKTLIRVSFRAEPR